MRLIFPVPMSSHVDLGFPWSEESSSSINSAMWISSAVKMTADDAALHWGGVVPLLITEADRGDAIAPGGCSCVDVDDKIYI